MDMKKQALLLLKYNHNGQVNIDDYIAMYADHLFDKSTIDMAQYYDYRSSQKDESWYKMEDFNAIMAGVEPIEIAKNITEGDFSYYDDCFTFDPFGNLFSSKERNLKEKAKQDFDFISFYLIDNNIIDYDVAKEVIKEASRMMES